MPSGREKIRRLMIAINRIDEAYYLFEHHDDGVIKVAIEPDSDEDSRSGGRECSF